MRTNAEPAQNRSTVASLLVWTVFPAPSTGDAAGHGRGGLYEDIGEGLGYQEAQHQEFTASQTAGSASVSVTVEAVQGGDAKSFAPTSRTQQVEVKKNDEYQALTHQIEQTEADISTLEEREIELMLDIDTAKQEFEAEKAVILVRIEAQRQEIALLTEREGNLNASVAAARAEVAESRVGVDVDYLEQYDRVKKMVKRAPYLAPIEAHKCGGCHLRVSNEISRGAQNAGEPHFCDQCARMVYA
jgi:hypothetical protein